MSKKEKRPLILFSGGLDSTWMLLRDLVKEIEHDTDPAVRHLSTVAESILARITS